MRPPLYMWSVVDRNVVMRRTPLFCYLVLRKAYVTSRNLYIYIYMYIYIFFCGAAAQSWAWPPHS